MSRPRLSLVVFSLLLSLPAAAFDRGDVLLENRSHRPGDGNSTSYDSWIHFGWHYAFAMGSALMYKPVPYHGVPGHFLIPTPADIVFHHERIVSHWDGVPRRGNTPGKGYTEIFTADAELSEIAPMRSGNYLVAERWTDGSRAARVIEFNVRGRVAEHPFPELIDPATRRALGATHIELSSDQCTLLYTLGGDDPGGSRVRRMNLCYASGAGRFRDPAAGRVRGLDSPIAERGHSRGERRSGVAVRLQRLAAAYL